MTPPSSLYWYPLYAHYVYVRTHLVLLFITLLLVDAQQRTVDSINGRYIDHPLCRGYTPLCIRYTPLCIETTPLCRGYTPLCVRYMPFCIEITPLSNIPCSKVEINENWLVLMQLGNVTLVAFWGFLRNYFLDHSSLHRQVKKKGKGTNTRSGFLH